MPEHTSRPVSGGNAQVFALRSEESLHLWVLGGLIDRLWYYVLSRLLSIGYNFSHETIGLPYRQFNAKCWCILFLVQQRGQWWDHDSLLG